MVPCLNTTATPLLLVKVDCEMCQVCSALDKSRMPNYVACGNSYCK